MGRSLIADLDLFLAVSLLAWATNEAPVGNYLGQEPPGLVPERFAPQLLQYRSFGGTFNPDLTEFYFTGQMVEGEPNRILGFHLIDGQWRYVGEASFVRLSTAIEPHIAPSGDRVFYTAADGSGRWKGYVAERGPDRWGRPQALPSPINHPDYLPMYFSSTADGTLYWTQLGDNGQFIVRTPRLEDGYGPIERLGPEVNPPGGAAHPFVSPDETILLFDRYVGPNDTDGDLFVSFRLSDGSWSEAQAVEVVNTDATELAASLSPVIAHEFGGLAKLASYSLSDQKKRFRRFFQATARTAVARVAILQPGGYRSTGSMPASSTRTARRPTSVYTSPPEGSGDRAPQRLMKRMSEVQQRLKNEDQPP
jgi:hypothetical protein